MTNSENKGTRGQYTTTETYEQGIEKFTDGEQAGHGNEKTDPDEEIGREGNESEQDGWICAGCNKKTAWKWSMCPVEGCGKGRPFNQKRSSLKELPNIDKKS
ncbi:MAG: hypothetical protein ABH832_04185 [bacterium]